MQNNFMSKNRFQAGVLVLASVLLLTLASPGFGRGFLAWFALVPLLMAVDKKYISAFSGGSLFGFFYYFYGISWLSFPITEIGGAPIIVSWVVTGFFALYLALYYGLTMLIFSKSKMYLLYVPVFFAFGEYLRGFFLSGFPWLTLAQTQYEYPNILKLLAFSGEYGLSFLIVLGNLLIFKGVRNKNHLLFAFGIFLPVSIYLLGLTLPKAEVVGEAKVRIIQTGVSQEDKWSQEKLENVVNAVQLKVLESEYQNYDLLVLPETAYPVLLDDAPVVNLTLRTIGEDTPIISGMIRREDTGLQYKYFNSAYMFSEEGLSIYDKVHLVPFGEYFPLGGIFSFIDDFFFNGASDYSKGKEFGVFKTGDMTIAPMICYEGAFYKQLMTQSRAGANLAVIISNDSWFGFSHGRYQHLAVDVMRSAEFKIWIARATQTGISAFIDENGGVVSALGVGETGYLDKRVKLIEAETLFSRFGYTWLIILGVFCLLIAVFRFLPSLNKP